MNYERIFCFGDSITLGANDAMGLGWSGRLGRLCAVEATIYNLGVNGDTSQNLASRWRAGADGRSRDARGLMLFAFGFNDPARADGGGAQVDLPESIAIARQLLAAASAYSATPWIGPTPLDESVNPMRRPFARWLMYNAEIARYDEAYADLAGELGLHCLRLFPDFLLSARYRAALDAGDGVHPAATAMR